MADEISREAQISADSNDAGLPNSAANNVANLKGVNAPQSSLTYKALIELDTQILKSPSGQKLKLNSGMQVIAEINQGQRTVMEYLLSPVQKITQEAGREK